MLVDALSIVGEFSAVKGVRAEKTMTIPGQQTTVLGSARWYSTQHCVVLSVMLAASTAASGSNYRIRVNKNGSAVGTFDLPATTNFIKNPASIELQEGDYVTIDIIQVGSLEPGSDVTITFEYAYL